MVEGYEGRPGAGKTLSMVNRAYLEKTRRGRAVYANVPLIDRRERRPKARRHFFAKSTLNEDTFGKPWSDGVLDTMEDMLKQDNCLCLLDEVHMWLPSTEWEKIDFSVRRFLAQQRKQGIDIWWTAQSAARVFNVVRELTATLWTCQRYGPLSVLLGRDPMTRENMGRKMLLVSPHIYQLYDTEFIVGSADGSTAGTYGYNARYHQTKPDPKSDQRGVPAGKVALVRREWPGGVVTYDRCVVGKDGEPYALSSGEERGRTPAREAGGGSPRAVESSIQAGAYVP